eukprot:TRINITY_DN14202_c0_g1_i1.p1 TRINITY_DN14202_c0_g1~~TRINITY_DN14202_c0_g1_i1.p1  ORF type:complete len:157 (+),score=23.53 TRINITY_DN14202_c0_g1_i1:279-749(+)
MFEAHTNLSKLQLDETQPDRYDILWSKPDSPIDEALLSLPDARLFTDFDLSSAAINNWLTKLADTDIAILELIVRDGGSNNIILPPIHWNSVATYRPLVISRGAAIRELHLLQPVSIAACDSLSIASLSITCEISPTLPKLDIASCQVLALDAPLP